MNEASVLVVVVVREVRRIGADLTLLEAQHRVHPVAARTVERARAIAHRQAFVGAPVDRDRDVAAVVCEVGAPGGSDRGLCAVTFAGDAVVGVDVKAFEVVLQDEVDNTRHRVGAVDGGCTTRQYLDTLDESHGNRADVHGRGALNTADMPATIDEDQGSVRTEATQVQDVGAVREIGPGVDRLFRRDGRQERRHVVNDVGDRKLAGHLDFLLADRLDRQCAGQVRVARNSGARNRDLFQRFFLFLGHGGARSETHDQCG